MHTAIEYLKAQIKLLLGRGVRKSYGQFGEDALIQALLKDIKRGIYVDVGAYHPTLYSNTYALYKKGWHGVAIDPNKTMEPLFKMLRPRDTFVCAAIGSGKDGTYHTFTDGAYNTFDPDEARQRQTLRWLKPTGTYQVAFKPLSQILHEEGVTKIDFLNVDVEGHDLDALQSLDWSVKPLVIAVEDTELTLDNPTQSKIFICLQEKGYSLAGVAGLTSVWKRGRTA